jgi:hypothetical protein
VIALARAETRNVVQRRGITLRGSHHPVQFGFEDRRRVTPPSPARTGTSGHARSWRSAKGERGRWGDRALVRLPYDASVASGLHVKGSAPARQCDGGRGGDPRGAGDPRRAVARASSEALPHSSHAALHDSFTSIVVAFQRLDVRMCGSPLSKRKRFVALEDPGLAVITIGEMFRGS